MGKNEPSDTAMLEPEAASSEPAPDANASGWTHRRPDVRGDFISLDFRRHSTQEQRYYEVQRAQSVVGSEEERFERFQQTEEYKTWEKTRFEYAQQIAYFGDRADALADAKANPMAEGSLATIRECSQDGNVAESVLSAYREAAKNARTAAERALVRMSNEECNAKFTELLAERESLMAKVTAVVAPLLDQLAQNSVALQKAKAPMPATHLLGPEPR